MKHGADDEGGKNLSQPPSAPVWWDVTHLTTHETKPALAQSAFAAARIAGWSLAECVPKRR